MRTLIFTLVADSQCCANTLTEIHNLKNKMVNELKDIPGIDIRVHNERIRSLSGRTQRMADFWVQKNNKNVTWNSLFKLINGVKPVPYRFKNLHEIRKIKTSPLINSFQFK